MRRNRRKKKENSETFLLDSFLFKLISKSLLGAVIIVGLLTLIQCTVKKPESPQWTTTFNVPLVNRTYDMNELLGKIGEERLKFDSLGQLSFSFAEPFDTVTLNGDVLVTDNLHYVTGQTLGEIDIDPPPSAEVDFGLYSIVGLATSLPGDSAALVPMGFNLTNTLPTQTAFSEASVDTGRVWAVIHNNLGITLDTVIMQLYDMDSLRSVAVDTFSTPLLDGATDSVALVLDGKNISNNFRLLSFCHTPGGIVDSASTRNVGTRLSFSNQFDVSYALAVIPALARNYTSSVDLNETDQIDSAGLSSGNVHMTLSNETPVPADLIVTLSDIYDAGVPVSVSRTVYPGQYTVIDVPLAGKVMKPSGPPDSQYVDVRVDFDSPGTGSLQVPIRSSDQFTFNADMTNLGFAYVSGFFSPKYADLDSLEQILDVPEGFDSLEFSNVQIDVRVDNFFSLPGTVDLTILGDNGKSLNMSGPINPNDTTILSRGDSAVADFLYPMPKVLHITGTAAMAGGGMLGTITSGDYITGEVSVFAPLEVIVHQSTIDADISAQEIDQSDIEMVTNHVQQARFIYTIENHLPLGASFDVLIGPDSSKVETNPQVVLSQLNVQAAPLGTDGLATAVQTTGSQEVVLDNEDIQVLKNATVYIAQQIKLEDSNGQTIKFSPNDFITVTGRIEVQYLFDGDF